MKNSTVISVKNIGKKYILNHQSSENYKALRDVLAKGARRFAKKLFHPFDAPGNNPAREEFWALKDMNFEINQGDRVGIVGRNGAGKSTLLKVLSRITEPTTGSIRIRGKVASLLEVGTGFHPELTGRENIFLNGAIIGMSKVEIKKSFDEIVAFAEVEKFLDTPVKRYSSGMYVRLAFAVAAYLESDILIVDEVLAVGDAAFQKKCLNQMDSVANNGRTVLFVSHNMGAISELCNRAILLNQGQKVADGETSHIIEKYMSYSKTAVNLSLGSHHDFPIYTTKIRLIDKLGNQVSEVVFGEDAVLEVKYTINSPLSNVTVAMLLSRYGSPLLYSYDTDIPEKPLVYKREPGQYVAYIPLPLARFKEGTYMVEIKIGVGQTNMTDEGAALVFEIVNHHEDATHKSFRTDRSGHLYWPLKWITKKC